MATGSGAGDSGNGVAAATLDGKPPRALGSINVPPTQIHLATITTTVINTFVRIRAANSRTISNAMRMTRT